MASSTHSLDNLKHYHKEALQFFASEILLLKEVIPKIVDERLAKCATLLMSCGQTGAALLQLASQTENFTSESTMLARAFMEKITNFCYASICDEKEYRAFQLHPIYRHYHNLENPRLEDDLGSFDVIFAARKEKQEKLKKNDIVQEALTIFSETKPHLNWTKKTLSQRIQTLEEWGKFMDFIFVINKTQYYSDASETLHGSLYGCTYSLGLFDPDFDREKPEELEKKLFKDSACMLLHLGMLIHESFTLINYTDKIEEIWNHSYKNRSHALGLLMHIIERKQKQN